MSQRIPIARRLAGSIALALVLSVAGRAQAGAPGPIASVFIAVDEYGNGTIRFVPSDGSPPESDTLFSALLPDPGPGGLPSALTYLLGAPQIVPGDVLLIEPATDATSDVLRFNPGIASFPTSLVFYSDNSEDEPETGVLADTGFPDGRYTNVAFINEVGPEENNYADYTPTPNQPGFVPGYDVHYHFVSDGTIPEPASLSLLALGSLSLLKRRRTAA